MSFERLEVRAEMVADSCRLSLPHLPMLIFCFPHVKRNSPAGPLRGTALHESRKAG